MEYTQAPLNPDKVIEYLRSQGHTPSNLPMLRQLMEDYDRAQLVPGQRQAQATLSNPVGGRSWTSMGLLAGAAVVTAWAAKAYAGAVVQPGHRLAVAVIRFQTTDDVKQAGDAALNLRGWRDWWITDSALARGCLQIECRSGRSHLRLPDHKNIEDQDLPNMVYLTREETGRLEVLTSDPEEEFIAFEWLRQRPS